MGPTCEHCRNRGSQVAKLQLAVLRRADDWTLPRRSEPINVTPQDSAYAQFSSSQSLHRREIIFEGFDGRRNVKYSFARRADMTWDVEHVLYASRSSQM